MMDKIEYTEENLKNTLLKVINLNCGPNDLDKKTNAKIASNIFLSKSIIDSSDKLVQSNNELCNTITLTSKNNNEFLESENRKKIKAEKENIDNLIKSNKLLSDSNEKYSKGMLYATIIMAFCVLGQIILEVM